MPQPVRLLSRTDLSFGSLPGRFAEMRFGSIFLLAMSVAMDATAVAAARGLATPKVQLRHVVLVAGLFGGFQAGMPVLGWLIGRRIGPLVQAWDHWIAFALLIAIGGKMLWDARGADRDDLVETGTQDLYRMRVMLVLAIATSIDAMAVGVTLPMLDAPLLLSIVTIGVTTAAFSAAGLFAGRRFGVHLGSRLDVLGGLVLVGLGAKILIEHLLATS